MNGKQYLARQIENLPLGVWSFVTALTNGRLQYMPSLDEHLPAPEGNEYKTTEYWIQSDGTVLRKRITYRNPRLSDECDYAEQSIAFSGEKYVLGDPEVSEQKLREDEYTDQIRCIEARLDMLQRFWKGLGEERQRELCAEL